MRATLTRIHYRRLVAKPHPRANTTSRWSDWVKKAQTDRNMVYKIAFFALID